MATSSNQWQARLKQALLQDPTKTSVMGVLLLVLVIVAVRAAMTGGASHPTAAVGGVVPAVAAAPVMQSRTDSMVPRADAPLKNWLNQKVNPPQRNDFLVRVDSFPVDPAKPQVALPDDSFWKRFAKSMAAQADQNDRRQKRIEEMTLQAETIRPQSTMMGSNPRAMVNGKLLAVGDLVAGYRLLKVEPRGIVVERDGVRFEVPMK